jgi:DNA-binding IclR family transcriptional regulator
MHMKVSISRSVSRAFEVMEVFKETRRPATATEIRQKLACPHSSAVAVLHNLVELGYLSYNEQVHRYFPTGKLSSLGTWVQPVLKGSGKIRYIADAIALETGHSTAITCRNSIFLNIVYVRRGHNPQSEQFSAGIGVSLPRSIPGIAILAQMTDDDVRETVQKINQWSKKARAEQQSDLDDVMIAVHAAREQGAAIGFDWSFEGTGAVAAPLRSPFDNNLLAISTTGPTRLIKPRAQEIQDVIEHYVRLYENGVPQPWQRWDSKQALRARVSCLDGDQRTVPQTRRRRVAVAPDPVRQTAS